VNRRPPPAASSVATLQMKVADGLFPCPNRTCEMGNEPEQLDISATCTFDVDQLKITTMVLDVRGSVPGLDEEGFRNATEQAEQGYPVSNALRGNVDIQLNVSLD